MPHHLRSLPVVAVFLATAASPVAAQDPLPVIDMHLHAFSAGAQGPPPLAMCTPAEFPVWDPAAPWPPRLMAAAKDPGCDDPVWSPETDEALLRETMAVMERRNVIGVVSGPPERVARWRSRAPDRVLPAVSFNLARDGVVTPDSLRRLVESGAVRVFGEITNQYSGIAPDDPRMEPYWDVAEELDIPVGIHLGPGPPGAPYLATPEYRAGLGNPLDLEDVLVRHPGLRVYVMHAGYPMADELVALLYTHPQVHVDVGEIVFTRPRAEFYRFLERIVDAGFVDRVMFGSDQMVWPGVIERAIGTIEEAPFLSEEQKRAILYDNAARFLRLTEEEIGRHHGG